MDTTSRILLRPPFLWQPHRKCVFLLLFARECSHCQNLSATYLGKLLEETLQKRNSWGTAGDLGLFIHCSCLHLGYLQDYPQRWSPKSNISRGTQPMAAVPARSDHRSWGDLLCGCNPLSESGSLSLSMYYVGFTIALDRFLFYLC